MQPYLKIAGALPVLVLALFSSTPPARAHCPVFGGGIGAAGPINSFSAGTLPQGRGVIAARTEYLRFDPLPAQSLERAAMAGETAHSLKSQKVYLLGGAYGAGDNLTLGASLPYLRREGIQAVHYHPNLGMSMQHDLGASEGVGDLTLYAQYRLVSDPWRGIDLSLIAALKAPTGETGNRSGGVRVDTEHQPGSGSWDPSVGAAVSKRIERLSLHASALYTAATSGSQSTELGDRAQASVAAAYRLGGKLDYGDCDETYEYFYPESRKRWLGDLVLELNGQWQGHTELSGRRDNSSGGTVLYLSPGARGSFDGRYSAWLSVGIPVLQQLHGNQSEVDYRLVAGAALAF